MNVSSTIPWLLGGLVGGIAFAAPIGAEPIPQPMLIAQQVVDGLPPPPVISGQNSLPAAPTGQTSDQPSVPMLSPTDPAQRYLVIVNGESPLLLSQVQAIVPDASVQEYNGQRFIQAGMFDNPGVAQQQIAALSAQGIGAEIVTVNAAQQTSASQTSTSQASSQSVQQAAAPTLPPPDLLPAEPVPREVEFGQPPVGQPSLGQPSGVQPPAQDQFTSPTPPQGIEGSMPQAQDSAFYVVIPGRSADVEAITNQILRLGDGLNVAEMVQVGDGRGSHVRIGPFVDRSAARRWNSYFREFGMDSRIYYKR